jgi:hypothetical protein
MEEAEHARGERPMYRPKGWNIEDREKERTRKKVNWYKKNGSESVIFVPATPGSQLQKEYQREVRSQRFKVGVVEKADESLKKMLQRSSPLKERQCRRMDCLVCTTGGKDPATGKVSRTRSFVTNAIVCILGSHREVHTREGQSI